MRVSLFKRFVGLAAVFTLFVPAAMTPVAAQERPPQEQDTLVALAYTLGESHALRQVCQGDDDQYWRDRMQHMSDTELAGGDLDVKLNRAFNSGFHARERQFRSCGPGIRQAQYQVARKGQGLARQMASVTRQTAVMVDPNAPPAPDSVANADTPR